jgi:hypothetical protein
MSSSDAPPAAAGESGDASTATAADGSIGTSQGGPNANADASARPGPDDGSVGDPAGPDDGSVGDPAAPPGGPAVPPASAVHCVGGDHDVTCAQGEACCTTGWSNDESTATCLSPGQTCETSDIATTRVTCDGTNCPQGSACCGTYRMANGGFVGLTETTCAVDCNPSSQSVLCDIHAAVDVCASFGAVCAPTHFLPAGYYSCAWAP